MSLIIFGIILFAFLGVPLFSIIAATSMVLFNSESIDVSVVIVEFYRLSNASVLIAIPLFTFSGFLLAESKTPERLVNFSRSLFGYFPGGFAIVTLISCAIFTALTGASGVTIVAIGGLLFPILLKENYSEKFSLGLITTSGSLGLLFPPSLPIILYGLIANISIDKLFIAGIFPGIILIIALSIYSIFYAKKNKIETYKFEIKKVFQSLNEIKWEIPLPFLVLGGIYGGYFTAIEASSFTAVYVIIVEIFIYRDLQISQLPKIMRESMMLVGVLIIILGSSMGLTNYLIDTEVPTKLFEIIKTFISNKFLFLMLLNLFLIVVGMMMDIFSAIIVVVPLIIPIAKFYGIDPIHLGIVFLTNLEIGYLTPPVGLNLFISSFRFEKNIGTVVKSVLPFILILLIALLIITYIPEFSLFFVE